MSNGVILYQSKYGATKKYAEWLSTETGFSVTETKKAKIENMDKYDTIVLGGGLYASRIAGLSFLKKNIEALKQKKIIVFCVGASPYDKDSFREIVNCNMKNELSKISCFYCRGMWDLNNMSFIDRNLCKMLQKSVAKKPAEDLEVWEMALVAADGAFCDWTDKAYLAPIITALQT